MRLFLGQVLAGKGKPQDSEAFKSPSRTFRGMEQGMWMLLMKTVAGEHHLGPKDGVLSNRRLVLGLGPGAQ